MKKCLESLRNRVACFRDKICQAALVKKIRDSKVAAICRAHPLIVHALLIIVYRLLFDALYIKVISPVHTYAGFITQPYPLRYGVSLLTVLLFAPAVAWHQRQKHASATLFTIINYLFFIPMTCYYGCRGMDYRFYIVAVIYWAVLLLLQAKVPVLTVKPFPTQRVKWLFPLLTVGSAAMIMFISGRYTGFRLTFDILNVYGIRAEAAAYQIPGILSYALAMMPCLLSVLILYWLKKKRYLIAFLLCIVFLFLFSIAAHKAIFFMLILALGCWVVFRPWMAKWFGGLMAVGVLVSFAEFAVRGSSYIADTFFRRLCLLPVQIGSQYAEFFGENPLNLFRDGILGKFSFDGIYTATIPRIIGEFRNYFNQNANNGLLGDMYANLPPALGMFIMPLIITIEFRILDMFSGNVDKKIVFPFCVFYAISFIDSSWSTVLLTGGFLLLCLLLYIFPKEEKNTL